jgi:hypothetical protein
VADGRHRGTAARTVADLVERWHEWRLGVKEISLTTLEGYRRQIDQRLIPALGRIPCGAWTGDAGHLLRGLVESS